MIIRDTVRWDITSGIKISLRITSYSIGKIRVTDITMNVEPRMWDATDN